MTPHHLMLNKSSATKFIGLNNVLFPAKRQQLTRTCSKCHQKKPLSSYYNNDYYCNNCRKLAVKKAREKTLYNKITNYFIEINDSTYFSSLDKILPGLSNFHEHTIFNINTYYHFLFFSKKYHPVLCEIFNSLYIPTHHLEKDLSNYLQIIPPSSTQIRGIRKFARYITREKICLRCRITHPTYTLSSQPQLISTEEVKEILEKIIQQNRYPKIRNQAFEKSYNTMSGWSSHCLACLTYLKNRK